MTPIMRHSTRIAAIAATTFATATLTHAATLDVVRKLTADDAAARHFFGDSVAISGTTAIIGSPGDDGSGPRSGSAYLFDTTTGAQLAKLTADDAAEYDGFGVSVAISGTTAIVGSLEGDADTVIGSGAAYLFDVLTGAQIAKLTADDAASGDRFGYSVAISGTTAIIGSPGDDDAGSRSGSAYLFDITTGAQLAKLTADDARSREVFGTSVAISGTTAIVGNPGRDVLETDIGSAYLFDVPTGAQIAKLTADDVANLDEFGISVAISGTTAIVGSRKDDDGGFNSGSAYLFDTTTGAQIAKLTAYDADSGDAFGRSVAISGTTAIVGSIGSDGGDINSGSAYLYTSSSPAPVPLPGSIWLLGLGLAGLGLTRRSAMK